MTQTASEQFVGQLNANVFFAEFAFASNQLRVAGVGEVELADHLVILDDLALIFQVKERSVAADHSAASITSWFAKKVRKEAVSQVAKTKAMMRQFAGSRIHNQRGHEVALPKSPPSRISAVVIYDAPNVAGFYAPKYCTSKSAGFVHFIAAHDYLGICQLLVTPVEVIDYLNFRQEAVEALAFAPMPVSEAALAGQYIGGDPKAIPNERFANVFDALIHDRDQWDVSFLTQRLGEQIVYREGDTSEQSHYRILAELAKLTRSELRELKTRLKLALESVRADEFELPYRFAAPRNDCGFLILPVQSGMHAHARTALTNLSLASKHELKVSKHVSLSIRKTKSFIDIEWMFIDSPSCKDEDIDAMLARSYPFRKLKEDVKPRYQFDSGGLRQALSDSD